MLNEMDLPAFLYLGEWLETDLPCRRALNETASGMRALCDFATAYGVHRTLRTLPEETRLQAAYEALMEVSRPVDRDGAFFAVCTYAERLNKLYGSGAPSAATKFLWLRFGYPIRIYDSLAWAWLKEFDESMSVSQDISQWYPSYYDVWQRAYEEKAGDIPDACQKLNGLSYLTDAASTTGEGLPEWTASRWFQERVFDRYMIHATSKTTL